MSLLSSIQTIQAKTLQHVSMSAVENQQVASMTVSILKSICSDEHSNPFWDLVTLKAELGVSKPQLPWWREIICTLDHWMMVHLLECPPTPKVYLKQAYFKVIDLFTNCIQKWFDQPGYQIYQSLDTSWSKPVNRRSWGRLRFYSHVLPGWLWYRNLSFPVANICCTLLHSWGPGSTNLYLWSQALLSFTFSWPNCSSFSVRCLQQLMLVMPATNAKSETSFSALCCLKNYLRTTMAQEWLNHLIIMQVHKEQTDNLDINSISNVSVGVSEHRSRILAKY